MTSAPPESILPQRRAEIAPLADGEAEPEQEPEEPAARAAREVAEAQALREDWEAGQRDSAPFDLMVQPAIGGEEAAVTLSVEDLEQPRLRVELTLTHAAPVSCQLPPPRPVGERSEGNNN